MSTNYPTGLTTYTNPTATDQVAVAVGGRTHSVFHSDNNDDIEALQAKVGVDGSAVTTTHDYKLSEVTSTDKSVGKSATQTLVNKTIDGNSNTLTVLAPTQLSGLVPMANGGLNVALSDPNADRILFWDDSAGQYAYLTPGSGLTIAGTTISASGTVLNTTMTANEDLTIGQTVGISNFVTGDKIARANRFVETIAVGVTQNNNLDLYNANSSCAIGGDKFAYIVVDASNDMYVFAGSVATATLDTTIGTGVLVTADYTTSNPVSNASICKLDTDKFIVLYREQASTTIIKYVIGTVSGTTVTLGTPATFATGASQVDTIASTYLSTDKAVMFYGCATPTDSAVITFTTTGTATNVVGATASVGTTLDNNIASPRIVKVTTDTFLLATQSGYAQAGTCIGGTTSTMGAEANTTISASGIGTYIAVLTTGLAVVGYVTAGNNGEYSACTISGTTLTFGTPLTGSQFYSGIYADSSSSFIAQNYSGSTGVKRYTVSGTTITLDKTVILGISNFQNILTMDNGYYIIVAQSSANFNINVQGMSNSFLGIAQATVAKGATVSVLYSGQDANQTGLVAGGVYEPNGTGGLTLLSSSSTTFTSGKSPQMKAINSTTVII
jgi:hypothetical protein